MTTFYLAGPMTGIPQFNFPVFISAASELREQGYDIISPAELDNPDTREAALASPDGAPGSGTANGETYGDFLSRDIKLVIDKVDGVVTLPDWFKSRGARIEVFTAATMGKPVYQYDAVDTALIEYGTRELAEKLRPGDPGINGHVTPAEAVGPPFTNPIAEAIKEATAKGEFTDAIIIPKGSRTRHSEGPPRLWGIPVKYSRDLPEGAFKLETHPQSPPGPPAVINNLAPEQQDTAQTGGETFIEDVTGEVRTTDPDTGGQKGSKLERFDLIPAIPLRWLAAHYGEGAKKYEDRNWERGYAWSLSYAALSRHLNAWWGGEDDDPETGSHHLTAVAWHAFALLEFSGTHPEKDDRP